MMALVSAVLVASLVGSVHCAGMCGGLAAFCAGAGECSARRSARATCIYHASRFLSYAMVGALAGGCGILLNAGGVLVGIQEVASIMAGVTIAFVGVSILMRSAGIGIAATAVPARLQKFLAMIHRSAALMPPSRRALVIGLATPLLPCGWFWAFAIVSAGTGSIGDGLLVMLAFWAGTVPILALVGAGIASLSGQRRRALTAVAGAAMIGVGIYTAGMRAPIASSVAVELQRRAQANHVDALTNVEPACCKTGADAP